MIEAEDWKQENYYLVFLKKRVENIHAIKQKQVNQYSKKEQKKELTNTNIKKVEVISPCNKYNYDIRCVNYIFIYLFKA